MNKMKLEQYTSEEVIKRISELVDAIVVVDKTTDRYRTVISRGIFTELFDEEGDYNDLISTLLVHLNTTSDKVAESYQAFLPNYGTFTEKYSRKLKLVINEGEAAHIVQMMVYPMADEDAYMLIVDELDPDEKETESKTYRKVETIEKTFLFSMYIDLVEDSTGSLNISEISEEAVQAELKYSDWRNMIVNAIGKDDQALFMERSDPEYLKKMFTPGTTSSFDCLMQNLDGVYIWVKLIFSRIETGDPADYKYVFMVQNIHEEATAMFTSLKKLGEMALMDSLTGVYNRGKIETTAKKAVKEWKEGDRKDALSMMIIDIDYFKAVNDGYGHAVGDKTLKQFARIMTGCFKEETSDIGRWGGEEFVVILYGKALDEAVALAERLRSDVEGFTMPEGNRITCSIGVTQVSEKDSFEDAFERMDKALYTAKSEGRNKVTTG
ncbi:MAG: GGDEF domain-containing protein [Lachnospiraceae bacterium]|nr:GGDEF domain-containing protein [Lachnospiraceae bacterium]